MSYFQPDRLSWQDNIWGNSREKEEWSQQPLGSTGQHLACTSLRPPQKWLIREQGRCQITLEADFSLFMGKSETASLSGLQLRLHAECDPQNEMPVFNPSSYSASSLSPCGNCGCYWLNAVPPPLCLVMLSLLEVALRLTSAWTPVEGLIMRIQLVSRWNLVECMFKPGSAQCCVYIYVWCDVHPQTQSGLASVGQGSQPVPSGSPWGIFLSRAHFCYMRP